MLTHIFRRFHLVIRQQPKHSRMCGYGEKVDRRPIDPPPIIQLVVDDPPQSTYAESVFFVFNLN
jgi:hypothetical protein